LESNITLSLFFVGIDAVLLINGEISSISKSCPTPLEFVATVANAFEDADSKYLDALEGVDGDLGKLLAYFAHRDDDGGGVAWLISSERDVVERVVRAYQVGRPRGGER